MLKSCSCIKKCFRRFKKNVGALQIKRLNCLSLLKLLSTLFSRSSPCPSFPIYKLLSILFSRSSSCPSFPIYKLLSILFSRSSSCPSFPIYNLLSILFSRSSPCPSFPIYKLLSILFSRSSSCPSFPIYPQCLYSFRHWWTCSCSEYGSNILLAGHWAIIDQSINQIFT
jgi:hypothetical protein